MYSENLVKGVVILAPYRSAADSEVINMNLKGRMSNKNKRQREAILIMVDWQNAEGVFPTAYLFNGVDNFVFLHHNL